MSDTVRLAVGLEYDGSAYAGWQVQPHSPSIQAVAESAFSRIADHPLTLTCAGRTDAGVHALGQVAHFDTQAIRTPRAWALGATAALPDDVSVQWAAEVPNDFHARYSALARTYRYLIVNRASRPALERHRACWVHRALDAQRMAAAAALLVGEHDFSAFRSSECQSRTPVRRVDAVDVQRYGEWVVIDVRANAFLHHMVRNIAGLLMRIGAGEAEVEWARAVLEGRDRRLGAATAPPAGLYLMEVRYPDAFGLPRGPDKAAGGASFMMPRQSVDP
ncbi:MAG TPA: tRNA pseudouridine(38-40) synthase TruA [Steroidobacteraceae bacterium]|nr:tRNA pseudouridine(38-40) synthase TruA [Steroidobacteraceae bacterium]